MRTDATRQVSAFTLFEIAISLALVAVAVTSVLMLFPMGIKAQQLARFRLYACAKAEEMTESFAATHNGNTQQDVEAFNPWDAPVSYRNMAHDMETRLANPEFGLLPLPPTIARRIDSDGDEIRRVLDENGSIYYSQPMATTGVAERALADQQAGERQKLLCAVVGYAQNNMVPLLPWKAWPYRMPYPSPPQHGLHFTNQYLPSDAITYNWVNRYEQDQPHNAQYCFEAVEDKQVGVVFSYDEGGVSYGFKPYAYDYAYDDLGPAEATARCIRYVQAACWYATQKGLTDADFAPGGSPAPMTAFTGKCGDEASELRAWRYLAHAMTCLTRWYSDNDFASGVVRIDPVTLQSRPSSASSITVTQDLIVFLHETCMNLAMRFSAEHPYDWGSPRPLQRTQMMDYPLIEYDLMAPGDRVKGDIFAMPGQHAEQWRPISGSPVVHLGRSYQYPDRDIARVAPVGDTTNAYIDPSDRGKPIWGDQRDFTLAMPFAPAERCRQIVFWAVDWQAYEDFETAPSAPVDASRYNLASELKDYPTGPNPAERTMSQRMSDVLWSDASLYIFRNPEANLLFKSDPIAAGKKPGDRIDDVLMTNLDGIDQGDQRDHKAAFLGLWGGDRNFNHVLDAGPLPKSTSVRAVLVARFNIYDPRVPLTIR